MGKFDPMLAFTATVLLLVVVGAMQFLQAWPNAARGLLLYEQTCPLNR
jgi:hypothetical protein